MNNINGLPGYPTGSSWAPRNVRVGTQNVAYLPGGAVIDGTNSGDAGNTGYVHTLRPGKIMVKAASGGLYRNFIIGVTTAAYVDNDVTLTVGAATATECARLIAAAGASISLALIGPPSAAGTVAATAITVTAASGTTLTIADLNLAKVTNSLIALPTSGYTAGTFCIVDNDDFISCQDETGVRANQKFARPLIGGLIDSTLLIDYPADTSTRTYLKALLNAADGAGRFAFTENN